ncbi:MAG: hypothetical protein H6923_06875 [Alphaproteobacteria bacterium]|nr:hypothetical protein [Alphaproteobacteria bacterium]
MPDPTTATLDIHLVSPAALFNALDPSPFVERDLDDEVEANLVDYVQDVPREAGLALRVHVPGEVGAPFDAPTIGEAVRHYFAYMKERETRRLAHLLREGRRALLAGAAFLIVCTLLGQFALEVPGGTAGKLLQEGLLIIGWVANWRPVEIFLYEWRPVRARIRVYARLAGMAVEIVPAHTAPAARNPGPFHPSGYNNNS